MKVLDNINADTFEKSVDVEVNKDATIVMVNLKRPAGVERVKVVSERQTVLGKESPEDIAMCFCGHRQRKGSIQGYVSRNQDGVPAIIPK